MCGSPAQYVDMGAAKLERIEHGWIASASDHVGRASSTGHGPTLFAGLSKRIDLKLVSRLEFGSGAVAMRYELSR